MYGAYGKIVEVAAYWESALPIRVSVFVVDSDWPPGMSGGPVFNRDGEVVGIVSRSVRAEKSGTASPVEGLQIDLGRSHEIQVFAPSLDAPGWQVCWGLFTENENRPVSVHASDEDALIAGDALNYPYRVKKIVNKIGTEEWWVTCINRVYK